MDLTKIALSPLTTILLAKINETKRHILTIQIHPAGGSPHAGCGPVGAHVAHLPARCAMEYLPADAGRRGGYFHRRYVLGMADYHL